MPRKFSTQLNKKARGFTLIELMVVIGILAILMVLAIPAVGGYIENSKAQTNLANAKMIYNAAHAYLGSNPNKTIADVTFAAFISGNYLPSIPKTAEGNSYIIDTSGADVSINWANETDIVPESGGKYPY